MYVGVGGVDEAGVVEAVHDGIATPMVLQRQAMPPLVCEYVG